MSRKSLTTVLAVVAAILGVFGTTFGLTLDSAAIMAAVGAILVYVFFEGKADIRKISDASTKFKDPKFWITIVSAIIGALGSAGLQLPISPEVIISILTVIVGILFKVKK
jgi:uncharacterized membrane protein